MTPDDMARACSAVMSSYEEMGFDAAKANITLVTPKGFKRPPGFPRGYLLQVKDDDSRVWHFNAMRMADWLRKNHMVPA